MGTQCWPDVGQEWNSSWNPHALALEPRGFWRAGLLPSTICVLCEARSGACLRLSAMDVRNALSVDGRHVGGCMKSWPGLVELQYLASNICRFQVTCSHSKQRGPCSSSTRPPSLANIAGQPNIRTHAVNLIPIPPQRRASVAQKFRTRTANSLPSRSRHVTLPATAALNHFFLSANPHV